MTMGMSGKQFLIIFLKFLQIFSATSQIHQDKGEGTEPAMLQSLQLSQMSCTWSRNSSTNLYLPLLQFFSMVLKSMGFFTMLGQSVRFMPFQSTGCLKSQASLCYSRAFRIMFIFRVSSLSRLVWECSYSDDSMLVPMLITFTKKRPQQLHCNTMKAGNQIESYTHRVPSQHSLMTSFLHFNNKRDKFITCGEEGEINVYSLAPEGTITKLAYANVFDEVVVCVAWALPQAGGCVAVGGSKGSLAILRVDDGNGKILVEKHIDLEQSVAHSLSWHPHANHLLVGTVNGLIYFVNNQQQQWAIRKKLLLLVSNTSALVLNCFSGSSCQMAAVNSTLYQIFSFNRQQNKKSYEPIMRYDEQNIVALLSRTENAPNFLQIYVLTNKKLRSYQYQTNESTHKLQLKSEVDVQKYECDQMAWGWTQSELVLYSTRVPKKDKNADRLVSKPVVVRIRLNGKFVVEE